MSLLPYPERRRRSTVTSQSRGPQDVTHMVAHLTFAHCRPNRCDEVAKQCREDVLPLARAQWGYRGLYLLVDRAFERALVVSLWDTEDDARAYDGHQAYKAHLTEVSRHLVTPLWCDVYDVDTQA